MDLSSKSFVRLVRNLVRRLTVELFKDCMDTNGLLRIVCIEDEVGRTDYRL